MLITLLGNLGMFGELIPHQMQELRFDSILDGDIILQGSELRFSMDSLVEQNVAVTGSENTFLFNSKPTLTI